MVYRHCSLGPRSNGMWIFGFRILEFVCSNGDMSIRSPNVHRHCIGQRPTGSPAPAPAPAPAKIATPGCPRPKLSILPGIWPGIFIQQFQITVTKKW